MGENVFSFSRIVFMVSCETIKAVNTESASEFPNLNKYEAQRHRLLTRLSP